MAEYPFKDLLPLDEVLEREGYYRDWTHLDPEVFYSLTQISEYVKTKGYGVDVRLLIAQLAEHFGLKTTQVVDLANLLQQKFENLEGVTQSFTNNINSLVAQMEADKDAVIANVTVDSEVILARGGKATLGQRLDDTTAQLAQTVNALQNVEVNVKYPFDTTLTPAKGDGVTDDWEALTAIAHYCATNGYRMKLPDGDFLISKPFEGVSRLKLSGNGVGSRLIKKSNVKNSRGIDTVVDFYRQRDFEVKDIQLVGNRTSFAEGNTVTTDGLTIESSSYFNVEGVWVLNCLEGIKSLKNWTCSFIRPTAQLCQGYGFRLEGGTTSTTVINPTAWGCGGGYRIAGCIYSTIINPAADHISSGGSPNDPFLPTGSGGDYTNPLHIFDISASKLTIVSPGTENSHANYLRAEGVELTLLTPYIYNLENHSDTYYFISTRGTGQTNIEIVNPDFAEINNKKSPGFTRAGFFVENPDVQKIKVNKFIRMNDTFGSYTYSRGIKGMHYGYTKQIVELNQHTMHVGGSTPFIYDPENVELTIKVENNKKILALRNKKEARQEAKLPIPNRANLRVKVKGNFGSSYAPEFKLIEVDGETETVLKEFPGSPSFDFDEYITTNTVNDCYLVIATYRTTDFHDFSEFTIEQII